MKYRKLDAGGDMVMGTGADHHVNTPDAVAQAVRTRLRLLLGEWMLDTTDGTPWNTQVLGKYTAELHDAAIRERILGTPGVTRIAAFSSTTDREARALNISVTLDTAYGRTILQEPF